MSRSFGAALLGFLAFLTGCGTQVTALSPSSPEDPVDSTRDGASLGIYRAIVRAKVINSFDHLNRGDASVALGLMAPDVHYRFEGDHALGGERVTRVGVEKWFGRLFRLLHSRFVLRSVEVSGWPWATTVYTVFDDHVTPRCGPSYVNHGVQIAELEWGSAVRIRTFIDTGTHASRALDHDHRGDRGGERGADRGVALSTRRGTQPLFGARRTTSAPIGGRHRRAGARQSHGSDFRDSRRIGRGTIVAMRRAWPKRRSFMRHRSRSCG